MKADDETFGLAVKAYGSDLYRYAYWLCRDQHLAEDVVQDALLRAWKYWSRIENIDAIKYWLFTIVRREFLRRLSSRDRATFERWNDEALMHLPSSDPNPEDALALRQLLKKVPASLREPLVLQVLGGFKACEIAELLSISESAVNTRLTRARQWLKQRLNPSGIRREYQA